MSATPYVRGLRTVAAGCHAWFEPPGSWGLSNSGVVVSGDEALVVDTQNDMPRGRALLAAARKVAGRRDITTVVNTHDDGDHWFGNLFFDGARIVATSAAQKGMQELSRDPRTLRAAAPEGSVLQNWLNWRADVFDYAGWRPVLPTETFSGTISIDVGSTQVDVIEVGPAHTRGDAIVHVPESGVVFAGDIVFHRSTPIMWAGPVANYIAACDTILDLDPTVVVPGHGSATDAAGVREVRTYLTLVLEHAMKQYAAGASAHEAYLDIDLAEYRLWPHASRVYQTISRIYDELDPAYAGPGWADTMEIVIRDDAS
jgi:cyclase